MTPFDASGKKRFENIVGKEENAGNQHCLLFPHCFLLYQRQKLSFMLHLFCSLQMDKVKILSYGKWLKVALQILGRKFYKKNWKIILILPKPLYSQSL